MLYVSSISCYICIVSPFQYIFQCYFIMLHFTKCNIYIILPLHVTSTTKDFYIVPPLHSSTCTLCHLYQSPVHPATSTQSPVYPATSTQRHPLCPASVTSTPCHLYKHHLYTLIPLQSVTCTPSSSTPCYLYTLPTHLYTIALSYIFLYVSYVNIIWLSYRS